MVSIIIPVYNTPKKYIQRCLKSIKNQSYSDYEIIIVDDGSSEECAEYLDSVVDSRIIVIHQKNGGVSSARNNGIENSHGEFITFVDSDDYISPDFLEKSIALIEKHNADLVMGGINIKSSSGVQKCGIKNKKEIIYTDKSAVQKFFLTAQPDSESPELKGFRCGGPWCKLFRKNAVKNIRFKTDIPVYEDMVYNLESLENMGKIVIAPDIWYNYIIYSDSAMRKYRPDGINEQYRIFDFLTLYKKMHPEMKCAIAKKTGESIKKIITSTIYHRDSEYKNKKKTLRKIFNDKKIIRLLDGFNINEYSGLSGSERLYYRLCAEKRVNLLHMLFASKYIMQNTKKRFKI